MLQNKLKKIGIYKTELDKKRPFEGHLLEQIKNYYKIGLTYSSNALEGNTLTESETKVLLEDGLTVGGKPFKDFLETEGHAKAYDYMFSLINSNKITKENILEMHHLFYNSIDSKNAIMDSAVDNGLRSLPRVYKTVRPEIAFCGNILLYRMELLEMDGIEEFIKSAVLEFNDGIYRLGNSGSRGYGRIETEIV